MKELVGHYEAAELLGWKKQQVSVYVQRGKFPEPLQRLKSTPIWYKSDIQKFKDERLMKAMEFNNLDQTNSTIVISGGKELRTTQDPYVIDNGETYRAMAIDQENNPYMIEWEVNHPDFENLEDESEACDWNNPITVNKI